MAKVPSYTSLVRDARKLAAYYRQVQDDVRGLEPPEDGAVAHLLEELAKAIEEMLPR